MGSALLGDSALFGGGPSLTALVGTLSCAASAIR